MQAADISQVTQLLNRVREDQPGARDQLAQLLYAELRPLAAQLLRRMFHRNPADGTNTPTAIIDAAWMRIIRQRQEYDDRRHFFAIGSLQVRRVVIDYWREWKARGGPGERLRTDFGELKTRGCDHGFEYEDLFAAIDRLEALDPVEADVVRLRYLWDLKIDETAHALGIGHASVERYWRHAKAWLGQHLAGDEQ